MSLRRYRIQLIAALVIAFGGLAFVQLRGLSPKLGLDLEGGISVTLTATSSESIPSGVMDKTVEIIRQRIDALGALEPDVSRAGSANILIQLPGVEDEQEALALIGTTAQLTFRQVEEIIGPNVKPKKRPEVTEAVDETVNDQEVVYPSGEAEQEGTLYRLKPAVLTGEIVKRAEAVPDPTTGEWAVDIEMDGRGSEIWAGFTSDLACLRDEGEPVKEMVAIVLDGKVESAAGMRAPDQSGEGGVACGTGITGGQTQITIGTAPESQEEAKNLALVLRTGALPLTLEQSEVQKVSPTLGRDSLRGGLFAGMLGLGLVMVYVLLYYRALGLVVWAGLAVFSATLYALVTFLGFTLSLAGIAGFIVSVGITADSYIVSFERLKDEVRSGKSVRAAVERGMSRAFRTILVADFVTGSAAAILFWLAVGSVKGFALTLGLATIIDVLIAYYFTRPSVTLLARSKRFSEGRILGMKTALGVQS